MIYKENGMIDWDAVYARDAKHAEDPRIGDYWHEMFSPICVVVGRPEPDKVLICRTTVDVGKNRWAWHLQKLEVISIEDFSKSLRYDSAAMHDKFWANCVPEAQKFVRKYAITAMFGEE